MYKIDVYVSMYVSTYICILQKKCLRVIKLLKKTNHPGPCTQLHGLARINQLGSLNEFSLYMHHLRYVLLTETKLPHARSGVQP